jgi:predicted small lipoprotein YifL
MRKMFALAMVALLALTLALSVAGCGKKAEETPATSTETMPPADNSMMSDSTMHSDSAMADTSAKK